MNRINNNDINLIEETHTYVLESDPEVKFTSATELVSKYFSPFDADKIASKLVATNAKYVGMTAEELKETWSAATQHGTDVHKEIEDYLNTGEKPTHVKSLHGITWLNKYRMKSDIKIFPEVIVFSKELQIAGTIDILSLDIETGKYEIIDWKTGKYERVSYNGRLGIHPITQDLMDCSFVKYSLQLSLYRYLLEKYYGLSISNQIIAHIFDDECKGFVVPYYKDHIEKIILELNHKRS